jgi:hypothetical protein
MTQHQVTLVVSAVVVAVIVIAATGFFWARERRTKRLRARFGPEYDRLVKTEGEVRRAESVLEMRTQRREKFAIHSLSPDVCSGFTERWQVVQAQFVDDPKGSVSQADGLVNEVMRARGYPMADFDQRAADISVDHPRVVENYRAAHDISVLHNRGQASTEDLRKAMVHYRALFDELLAASLPEYAVPRRKEARG